MTQADYDIALKTLASLEVMMKAFEKHNPVQYAAVASHHHRLTRLMADWSLTDLSGLTKLGPLPVIPPKPRTPKGAQ